MTTAKTLRRKQRQRSIRAAKLGAAHDAIGPITKRCEIYVLTFGQFSLIDTLIHILDATGPAAVDISTWTAAHAHLDRSAKLLANANILKIRFLVDRSFIKRQAAYCEHMRALFGDDCIRVCKNHSKFLTVRNDDWDIAVRTSMNLNENPRLENLEISDDRRLAGFLTAVVDDIFADHSAGDFEFEEAPALATIENVELTGRVTAGRATANRIGNLKQCGTTKKCGIRNS